MGLCAGVGHPRHECLPRNEPCTPRLLWTEDVSAARVRRGATAPRRRAAPATAPPPAALPAVSATLVPGRIPAGLWRLRRAVPAAAARAARLGLARRHALPGWRTAGAARASCTTRLPAVCARAAAPRHALSVARPRTTSAEKALQQVVLQHARNRHPPDGGARRRPRVHHARLLLAGLLSERTTLQGEIQISESYPRAHWREAFPLPISWMRQSVCEIGKPQDSQKNTYR